MTGTLQCLIAQAALVVLLLEKLFTQCTTIVLLLFYALASTSWVLQSTNYLFPLSPTGHSHQLFHVCGIIGTYFQMQAIQKDMDLRRLWLHVHAPAITFRETLGATMLSIVISLAIICLFSYSLFHGPVQGKATKKESDAAKKK